jgi:hypothetical protein
MIRHHSHDTYMTLTDVSFRTPCATYWQPTPSCWCCRRSSGVYETTESAATLVLCDAAAQSTFLFRSSRSRSQVSSVSYQDFALGRVLGQLLRECTFHGIESLLRISGCRALLVSRILGDLGLSAVARLKGNLPELYQAAQR